MKTRKELCTAATKGLEAIKKNETALATNLTNQASEYEAKARVARAKAVTHATEAQETAKAIVNIKASFGVK